MAAASSSFCLGLGLTGLTGRRGLIKPSASGTSDPGLGRLSRDGVAVVLVVVVEVVVVGDGVGRVGADGRAVDGCRAVVVVVWLGWVFSSPSLPPLLTLP